MIDLHVHTCVSDGTLFPEDVVRLAATLGLRAIAITDHNSVLGLPEAIAEGEVCGVEIVPGVELNASCKVGLLHILGYFIHFENLHFQDCLAALREERVAHVRAIMALMGELHLSTFPEGTLESDACQVQARSKAQRSPSLASGEDQSQCLPQAKLLPAEVVRLIKAAGGVPVVAHPYSLTRYSGADWNILLRKLIDIGIEGIEAYHPSHTPAEIFLFEQSALENGLLVTGGSDFHCPGQSNFPLGFTAPLPYRMVENLKARAQGLNVG